MKKLILSLAFLAGIGMLQAQSLKKFTEKYADFYVETTGESIPNVAREEMQKQHLEFETIQILTSVLIHNDKTRKRFIRDQGKLRPEGYRKIDLDIIGEKEDICFDVRLFQKGGNETKTNDVILLLEMKTREEKDDILSLFLHATGAFDIPSFLEEINLGEEIEVKLSGKHF